MLARDAYTGRVRRLIPVSIVAVLALLSALTVGISIAQADSHPKVVMPISCTNKVGEPTSFVISCADANSEVSSLTWTDWGQATAYATGVVRWNDCTPTCVAGVWKQASINLWVWGVQKGRYTQISSNDPSVLPAQALSTYPG